jgi:mycothiol synthase
MPLRVATSGDESALWSLFDEIDRLDGYYPLTEAAVIAVRDGAGEGFVVTDGDDVVGFTHRRRTPEGWVVETAVHPACRPVQAHLALQAVVGDLGGASTRLWASDDETVSAARELGFVEGRQVIQLTRSLPIVDNPRLPDGVTVRPFRVGIDEDSFLEVNNAAFADHPDNGDWDREVLADRIGRPWFELDGFFMAWEGDDPVAVCWTKHHRGAVGEIYVIGVHPRAHRRGLGRAMTLIGFRYQHEVRGATTAMLYTEGSNDAALGLYSSLGFQTLRIKRGLTRF